MNWGGEYSKSKTKRKEKEKVCGICANNDPLGKRLQYSGIICHTWERLQYTGQLLKHSIGSTITMDAVWMRW